MILNIQGLNALLISYDLVICHLAASSLLLSNIVSTL